MELTIAGGVGEHGRNCFCLQDDRDAILIDCGRMAGSTDPLPRLEAALIPKLRAVFLTHSHADHTGALPWLLRQGYTGPILAATPTLQQLPFVVQNAVPLERVAPRGENCSGVTWGLSGHCAGSVWLEIRWNHKTVLFSGDYSEQSEVYPCDPLRGRTADLAVLDCAYGHDSLPQVTAAAEATRRLLQKVPLVFLPVPKYGRGLDLLLQLHRTMPHVPLYGDAHFCTQAKKLFSGDAWHKPLPPSGRIPVRQDAEEREGIVFLSDPQLSGKAGERARELLERGAAGVMTGTPDAGSFSSELLATGRMEFRRYPVHLNEAECDALIAKNRFEQVVRYHSADFTAPKTISVEKRK